MKGLSSLVTGWATALWVGCCFCATSFAAANPDVCAVCGEPIPDLYYSIEDHVTLEKSHVCKLCEQSYQDCFLCGVPANTNTPGFLRLSDGRVMCARDAKTAVLQPEDGLRISHEVRDGLDRLLSRFTSFPETNVIVGMVDRVHLLDLLKLAGNDYHCPNVFGYTQTKTNHNRLEHRVNLMSGLPLTWFEATCAHEFSHTWVAEHLAAGRKETLGREAEEGFCELIAFLYMDSLHDDAQKAIILHNGYTRGQIDLFVAAEKDYGFNEILDWMQFGMDDQLSAAEPDRIRKLQEQRAWKPPARGSPFAQAAPVPDTLVLKGIIWDQRRPLALINDRAFSPNEEATVRVGNTNVVVRCLTISPDSVQLRVAGALEEQTLRLRTK
jgi:hypothetical protein